jgi:S1-C subfamily serine protease
MTPLFRTALPVCLAALLLAPAAFAATRSEEPSAAISHEAENTVVKVFSTMRRPDLSRPWGKAAPIEASGSGVIIEGKRILTNAHVVAYASQVQVQANQAGDKMAASVEAIGVGIDLAVLKLEDESFFKDRPTLPRASALPQIKEPVLVYGFPVGGTTLSITRGIVSRIEFVPYNIPVSALRVQIDAALNPGNSGGPALAGNKMIGLAFSHLQNSENIGYIIPNEEVELFLKSIDSSGHYAGKPGMYDELQTLENPALRGFLKVDNSVRGMVVHRPDQEIPGYPLKQWDVITRIDDSPIDDEGMVGIRDGLRLNFAYLIQKNARDGNVALTVVRNGRSQQIQMPVPPQRPLLIDTLRGSYPSYFIVGPLVFERATLEALQLVRSRGQAVIGSPLVARLGDRPDAERDELVIIPAPLFPHTLSKGYSDPTGSVLKSINGTPIRSLAHLVALLRDLKDEFVALDFDNRASEAMVFPRKELVASTETILADNGVRAQGSPDMMKIWEQK